MALLPDERFTPNVFFDIGERLDAKLAIMALYDSEFGTFPFPRSAEAMTAQARLHGARIGAEAAEAFMLLHERL